MNLPPQFQFRFLTTPLQVWEEGRAMRHCAYDLVRGCELGICWVVSVTRAGAKVATLDLRQSDGKWRIHQLAGKANAPCNVATGLASLQMVENLTATQNQIDDSWPLKLADSQSPGADDKQCRAKSTSQANGIDSRISSENPQN